MFDLNRRHVLGGLAASAVLPVRGAASQSFELTAKAGLSQQLGPEGTGPASLWSYNGQVPGPVIRTTQGQPVRIRLNNQLDSETTVHWHGIRINNAMDGVANLTQSPISPGSSYEYSFTPPDAGTYWYHPHFRTWDQLARGLYGALIIEEPNPPAVDRDLPILIDDWRLTEEGTLDEGHLGNFHDWSHAGALGNWPTVNGQPQPSIPVKLNERLRLRLINVANATVLVPVLTGMSASIIAIDGQPIEPRTFPDELTLAPGQRVDVIADVVEKDSVSLRLGGREDFLLATFPVQGAARAERLGAPEALPSNGLVIPTGAPRDVRLSMAGGAMRWLDSASVGGRAASQLALNETGPLSGRELADHGMFWSFNDVAGMPETPLFSARKGEIIRITFENLTMFAHGMHLHGHHVWDAKDAAWRDTVLVEAGEAQRSVLFQADNPGRWMLHCHMLEHQASGMATWFEVS